MRNLVTYSLLAMCSLLCSRCSAQSSGEPDQVVNPYPIDQRIEKSADQWRLELDPEVFRITREKATERAFSGKYWDHDVQGLYNCACCGLALFHSSSKFASGTGWPSYYAPYDSTHIATAVDRTMGLARTEILCARCGAHLGHVFDDGPEPTGERFCVNSAALDFTK